ncbi:uncharacterized protein TNCV_2508801 [Trichonephila clavipes]|nr:uncharacterized protein TNCV_2508801 [Trichonephila clavipes]
MWFQRDGAPAIFSADWRSAFDTAYAGRRWIGRRGSPENWPARSPDLSCLDFFPWGHMKSLVYASPVDSDEPLVTRIAVVVGGIREKAGVFANVRHSLSRWWHLVCVVGYLKSYRCISQILKLGAMPYFRGLGDVIFHKDNAGIHVACCVLIHLNTERVRLLRWLQTYHLLKTSDNVERLVYHLSQGTMIYEN